MVCHLRERAAPRPTKPPRIAGTLTSLDVLMRYVENAARLTPVARLAVVELLVFIRACWTRMPASLVTSFSVQVRRFDKLVRREKDKMNTLPLEPLGTTYPTHRCAGQPSRLQTDYC